MKMQYESEEQYQAREKARKRDEERAEEDARRRKAQADEVTNTMINAAAWL